MARARTEIPEQISGIPGSRSPRAASWPSGRPGPLAGHGPWPIQTSGQRAPGAAFCLVSMVISWVNSAVLDALFWVYTGAHIDLEIWTFGIDISVLVIYCRLQLAVIATFIKLVWTILGDYDDQF